ncbi:MAG: GerAB/ArcD/ProY family transporter [Clostridia bacterium]|nr:GerAB/ArcD/ProY family transporter [Clostridia bacterium]
MSKLQLFSVMSVGTLVYVYTYALNFLIETSATASFISAFIGCAVFLIVTLIATKLISSTGHEKLSDLVYDCAGDFFGMVINCLIVAAIILSMSERLFECIRLMKLYGYGNTAEVVIAGVIMLVAFYSAKSGHKAIAKTAVPVFFSVILGIVIVIFSGLGQFEMGNIFPIFGYGFGSSAKGSILTLSSVDNILIGLIFADKLCSRKVGRVSIAATITALVAYTACSFCYSLAFPYSLTQNSTSGIIDIARGAERSGFFQRFEAILLFIIILSMICFISIYLSAAIKQIDDTFAIKKKRSSVITLAIAILVFLIGVIPDNTRVDNNSILSIYRQYSFIFFLIIGVILLIGGIIKFKLYKKAVLALLFVGMGMSICSCADYREIENESYAVMIGIDEGVTDSTYSYSIRLMNEDNGIIIQSGESLGDVINKLSAQKSKSLSLKNLRILAISYDLAETGVLKFIEPIIEDTSTKNSIMLAICSDSAEKFVSAKRFGSMQEIELTVNNEGKSNVYDSISINKVYNAIFSTTKDPSAAYVVNGDGDNEDSISGTVMFSGEKAVGYLDGDETAIVKAINGKLKDYKLGFNGDEYSVSSKGAAKITLDNNIAQIEIRVTCSMGGKSVDKLPDNLKSMLTKRLNETINDISDAGSDILGIGYEAAKNYKTIDQFEKAEFKQKFKNLKLKAKISI